MLLDINIENMHKKDSEGFCSWMILSSSEPELVER